jgi:cytochrome b pre-mRNA-processing protein 3
MACESCRSQVRFLVRAATTSAAPRASVLAAASARRYNSSIGNAVRSAGRATRQQQSQSDPKEHVRHFSKTSTARFLQGVGGGTSTQPYFVVAATERIFKICGEQASYRISEAERKDGVRKLDDGEEVGHSTAKGSIWHESEFSVHTS